MTKSIRQILIDARALISDPMQWTRGTWARDDNGENAPYWSERAVCWCSLGAINHSCPPDGFVSQHNATTHLAEFMGNIAQFNDNKTHAEVLTAFDRAIANLKEDA